MSDRHVLDAATGALAQRPDLPGRRLFLKTGAVVGVAKALALFAPFAAGAASTLDLITTAVDRTPEPVDIHVYDPAGIALLPDDPAWRVLAFAPMNLRLHVHRVSASPSSIGTIDARLLAIGIGRRDFNWVGHQDRRWSAECRSAPLLTWLEQWEDEWHRGWGRV